MKKFFIVLVKFVLFFVGWGVCVGFIPTPNTSDPAIWRLWAEIIPLISIIVFTVCFWLWDKKEEKLRLISKPIKNSLIGMVTGSIWIGAAVIILYAIGVIHIENSNHIDMIGIWIVSAFLNTIMQEMLVRGYLYRVIQINYNTMSAGIGTTLLFTALHGGVFEAGIIPVLNVMTMSIFMTLVLEYTESLVAPIFIHFIWNCIGAIILGGVALADDYPHLLNMIFSGNELLSGGSYKMEGSIVVLVLNVLFIIGFMFAYKRKQENYSLTK